MKNFSLREVSERFRSLSPGGGIAVNPEKQGYIVWFAPGGKVYTYTCSTPYQLAKRLRLYADYEFEARKQYKRLPCGCPVPADDNNYRCANCGRPWREPTAEELKGMELWG